MKFCAYLKQVDSTSPAVFKGGYLRYKSLKKFIRYRSLRLRQAQGRERELLRGTAEIDVMRMLAEQLKAVDKRFEGEARSILAKFDSLNKGKRLFCIRTGADAKTWQALQVRLLWARRFARLNALALRKIAKKHDKALGSHAGHLYLQECWRGQAVVRAFLGGPLHAELAAVQALVSNKAPADERTLDKTQRQTLQQAIPEEARGEAGAKSMEADMLESTREDLTCPICMDLMFRPAALACGHTFCGRCCINAAGCGQGQVRSFHQLASVDTAGASCPMCRASRAAGGTVGVYEGAVELPHVGLLIQQRFRTEWQERQLEDEAEHGPQKRSWFQGSVSTSTGLGNRGI